MVRCPTQLDRIEIKLDRIVSDLRTILSGQDRLEAKLDALADTVGLYRVVTRSGHSAHIRRTTNVNQSHTYRPICDCGWKGEPTESANESRRSLNGHIEPL